MPQVNIGCSGFSYPHWAETFYPEKLNRQKWFQHYCSVFSSVELNVTFYRLPARATFDKWYDETPHDFVFSLKGSRFITHVKRLLVTDESLDRFFNGAVRLKEKLKTVLWQFPPTFKVNTERLAKFLEMLRGYPARNVLEFRHESWITSDIIEICKKHNTALCMADWPVFIDNLQVTSDVVYIRRHGRGGNYDTCYSPEELQRDAKRIRGYVRRGKDVFIYFNNDAYGYAPLNAKDLMELMSPL